MGLYTEFDLGLLYIFLRNLCGIRAHSNGWGKPPESSDRSVSANIDRLRIIRNSYVGHNNRMSVDNNKFEDVWKELLCVVGELEATLRPSTTAYTMALRDLKTQAMDPKQAEHYLNLFGEEFADVRCRLRAQDSTIAEIKEEQEETSKLLKRLSSLGDENFATEGIYILVSTVTVLKDRRFWKMYVRTSAVPGAIQKLKEHRVVILTGDKVGIGKSTTGKQILREISSEASESPPIPALINTPEDWKKVVNQKDPFIVFLDDFVGVSNFAIDVADIWKNHLDIILASAREGNVFVIVALRKHILDKARQHFTQAELFSEKFEINLSKEYQLTLEEKQKILESFEQNYKYPAHKIFGQQYEEMESHYESNGIVSLSEMDKTIIVKSDPYFGFPVTCFQFFSRPECFKQGPSFFLRPTRPLLSEIEEKRKSQSFREQVDYCVLAYVFVNGSIHLDDIDRNLFQIISSKLTLTNVTDVNIADAIEDLNGSLLSEVGRSSVFKFSHETILETVLVSFGKLAPDVVIKKCPKRKIHELIRTQNYQVKDNEVILRIPRKNYEELAERMLRGDDGDSIEVDAWEAALQIVFHSSSCDTEFVAVLLNRKPSERFSSVLSFIWTNLPITLVPSKKKPVLLSEMLKRYGPHLETSNKFQEQHTATTTPHYSISYEDIQYFLRSCLQCKHQNENIVLFVVQYLMEKESYQNVFNDSYVFSGCYLTFLHCCILRGWETTVDMILQFQSPTNAGNGWSCAHIAAFAGRPSLLRKLVARGQNISEKTEQRYTVKQTAFLGIRYGHEDMCFAENKSSQFHLMDKPDFHISFPSSDFKSALEFLLENENEVKKDEIAVLIDEFGNNIVHYCIMHNDKDILHIVLSQNKSIAFHRNDTELPSALHLAVYLGRIDMVREIWDIGVRPQKTDPSLLETFSSGEKHFDKKIRCFFQANGDDQRYYWCEGKKEIPYVKIRAAESVCVSFGNEIDFKRVKDFLEIEDIYVRIQNNF